MDSAVKVSREIEKLRLLYGLRIKTSIVDQYYD